jgi:hypothetical protein
MAKDYNQNEYAFVASLSNDKLYEAFLNKEDRVSRMFGECDYDLFVDIIIDFGDIDDNKSYDIDNIVIEQGDYIVGEFEDKWVLWMKKKDEECCPFCGSTNFEWMGEEYGEEPYHCHECDRFFKKPLI